MPALLSIRRPWLLAPLVVLAALPGATTALAQTTPYRAVRQNPGEAPPVHAYSEFNQPAPPEPAAPHHPGRVLIRLKRQTLSAPPRARQLAVAEPFGVAGLLSVTSIFPGAREPARASADGSTSAVPDLRLWLQAEVAPGTDLQAVRRELQAHPEIDVAELDHVYQLADAGGATPPRAAAGVPGGGETLPTAALGTVPTGTGDPLFGQQWYLDAAKVKNAWTDLLGRGLEPGGNRDVVVAVIDSGIDLAHPDLAPNLWVNSRETPGDGVDNDNNGIVDDVNGANFVGAVSGNPRDDNGHGTHVAGIIAAAANNGVGTVGVAFNCRVMALKAANRNGSLNESDVAKAIAYAVENGAHVINMSFGGSSRAQIVEDALLAAAPNAVLVAAAGNSGLPNELPAVPPRAFYPASYLFVLGVMAQNRVPTNGNHLAVFSNWDSVPGSQVEYEVMAPGQEILSTLPGGNHAAWSGTSMATPIVSGLAALMRTRFPDRVQYPPGFIQGQLASTGVPTQGITPPGKPPLNYPTIDAVAAMATPPTPDLVYLEHWVFDSPSIAAQNDGDGIADAGELIDLAIVVKNKWGRADPVTVKLEAMPENSTTPDPNVLWITDTVNYGAVGSFATDDNGLRYLNGVAHHVENPFRLRIAAATPNDYTIPLKITITATNGYNATDPHGPYVTTARIALKVQRGTEISGVLAESMTLTKDRFWIVAAPTLVPQGVSITVEPGAQVKLNSTLQVEGTFRAHGTLAQPIEIMGGTIVEAVGVPAQKTFQYVRFSGTQVGAAQQIYRCEFFNGARTTRVTDVVENKFVNIEAAGSNPEWGSLWNGAIERNLFRNPTLHDPTRSATYFLLGDARDNVFLMTPPAPVHAYGNMTIGVGTAGYISSLNLTNNSFLNPYWNGVTNTWLPIVAVGMSRTEVKDLSNNYWGTTSDAVINQLIHDFYDDFNLGEIRYLPKLITPSVTAWPHVVDVTLSNGTTSNLSRVGAEAVTFTVTFNRDMNTAIHPQVTFGPEIPATKVPVAPVNGGWQNARTWTGRYQINKLTGDGYQLIRVAGAVAASDPWFVTGDDDGRFRFEIVTSGLESLDLHATGAEGYIDLWWVQDDFELLAGYNIYRATAETGPYTLINPTIVPAAVRQYRDRDVIPGQTYYYKFTVVQTDMAESAPSNIAMATPNDTIAPQIVHVPITTAEPNLSLAFLADITDNVAVTAATLHFRAIGQSIYQSRTMVNSSAARWSAALEGSLVTAPGLEYYLSATDGHSTTLAARPEQPYVVAVADRPVITGITPTTGGIAGGQAVVIAGSNFKAGAKVFFGSTPATSVSVVSSSQISCQTPPSIPATVSVRVENANGASSTLLNAYTFVDSSPRLSLPDMSGNQGAIMTVPLDVSNVVGLKSATVTVSFDPTKLRVRGAVAGPFVSGWTFEANTGTTGQVRLSMATSGSALGSGSIARIDFELLGAPGQQAVLTLSSVVLNDGAITPQLTHGSLTVNSGFSIGGAVRYWSDSTRAVPGVDLTLEGVGTLTARTTSAGAYRFDNLQNAAYALRPAKTDQIEGITAYDAGLVLRHDVGLAALTGLAFAAGDVNVNGSVTALDAARILEHAAGLDPISVPSGNVPWAFDPGSRTYATLTGNQVDQNFTAILRGDVSGNWGTATGQSGETVRIGVFTVPDLVHNGGTSNTAQQRTRAYLVMQNPARPVLGVDVVLRFEPATAQLVDVSAPAAAGAFNDLVVGQLRSALARGSGLTGTQVLVEAVLVGGPAIGVSVQSISVNEGALLPTTGVDRLPAHSADTDLNFRVDLFELTRVIELYNTRSGSVRTGCYTVNSATEDGFAPDPARSGSDPVSLSRHHSADASPRDGRITLVELTRVIELYNTRAATVRTGRYAIENGTEDGFAPRR